MANDEVKDFAKNIKIISKTDKLQDSIDKAVKEIEQLSKSSINSERSTGYTSSNGSSQAVKGATTGANSTTTGTGSGGTPVTGPLAPPVPDPVTDPTKTVDKTDNHPTSNTSNNTDELENKDPQDKDTDINDKAHELPNSGGGTPYANQAQRGADDADVQNIVDAMTSAGYVTDDINSFLSSFLSVEPGVNDISDVYNGVAGPQPFDITSNLKQVLNGVVGVDPDDTTKSIGVRYDGVTPTPSDSDAAAAGQPPWVDGDAPLDTVWEAGYYWANTGNIITADGFNLNKFNSPEHAAGILRNLPTYNTLVSSCSIGLTIFTSLNISTISYLSSTSAVVHTDAYTYFCTNGTIGLVDLQPSFTKIACGANTDGSCGLLAPPLVSDFFPKTGIGFITKVDNPVSGVFNYSQYDSEVPLKYQNVSSVPIKSLIDGVTYRTALSINGGFSIFRDDLTGVALIYGADRTLKTIVPVGYLTYYTPRKVNL